MERFLILGREQHTLFSTETIFKETNLVTSLPVCLGVVRTRIFGNRCSETRIEKEKAHLFSECAGLIALCLVFSHVIYI